MYNDDIIVCCQGSGFQSVEYMTGILKGLEEYGLAPGRAMTSSGSSITMALYYSKGLEWVENMIKTHQPTDFIDFKPFAMVQEVLNMTNYFIDNKTLKEFLEENMTAEASLRQLTGVTRLRDFKNIMLPATPATVLAASAIEAVMKPVMIDGELFGDSGLLNNTPTVSFEEAKKYKHVFVCVAPEPKFNNDPNDKLFTYVVNLVQAIAHREVHQVRESGLLDLPNVTLIQPWSGLSSGLLNWSDNYEFMELCYHHTKEILAHVEI